MIDALKGFLTGILMYVGIWSPVEYVSPIPVVIPTATIAPTPTPAPLRSVDIQVPFTSQSPFGEWSDLRQQDACEEASVLMAVFWAKKIGITDKQYAEDVLLKMYDYEVENWGNGIDTSAADTAERLIKGYFEYSRYKVSTPKSYEDIVRELMRGNVVIVPTNGKLLFNSNFTGGGPDRHMLLIRGYDLERKQFITHDPGTRQGANYRYGQELLFNAIRDYVTGDHEPIVENTKKMISVSPAGL